MTILILKLSIVNFRWSCSTLYILWSLYFSTHQIARASSHVANINTRNKLLIEKLLKQGYRYHKLRKTLLNFIANTMILYLNSMSD